MSDQTKPRVKHVETTNRKELICPACGKPHLTLDEWTDDGPRFNCGSCAVKPTLTLISNDKSTKLYWSIF